MPKDAAAYGVKAPRCSCGTESCCLQGGDRLLLRSGPGLSMDHSMQRQMNIFASH